MLEITLHFVFCFDSLPGSLIYCIFSHSEYVKPFDIICLNNWPVEANNVRNIKNCLLFISWEDHISVFDDEKTFRPHSDFFSRFFRPHSDIFKNNKMMTLSMLSSSSYMGKTRSYWIYGINYMCFQLKAVWDRALQNCSGIGGWF